MLKKIYQLGKSLRSKKYEFCFPLPAFYLLIPISRLLPYMYQ